MAFNLIRQIKIDGNVETGATAAPVVANYWSTMTSSNALSAFSALDASTADSQRRRLGRPKGLPYPVS
jgi:hypothetical protein